MKKGLGKIRLPRKVMFIVAGVLVLSGASGAFAVYSGKESFLGNADAPSLSGLACSTIETLKMRRNGQRWIRKYVSTESGSGIDRVRTALRITGLLAKDEKADLYQVVVLDQAGPQDRADRRGPAVGAQVLFAPNPTKIPDMTAPFVAKYNDGKANTVGLFHGRDVSLSTEDIKSTLVAMDDRSDCIDPAAIAAAAAAAEGHGSSGEGHGAPSEGSEAHGAASHGEEGHGEEAPAEQAHGEEAHGEEAHGGEASAGAEHGGAPAAAEDAHAPEDAEHAEAKAPESGGLLASLTGMIFGHKTEGAPAVSAETSGDGHAIVEEPAPDHATAEEVATEHAVAEEPATEHAAAEEPAADHVTAEEPAADHGTVEAPATDHAAEAPAH